MMDCDTTGIEPDIALIKYKKLVGGGMLKIVNNTVPLALKKLGYSEIEQGEILGYLEREETIEGAPGLKAAHLPVFDCAFKPAKGHRSIHWMGHVKMMAACQPFLSGAISKTVNLPHDATPEDIEKAYMEAWKLGLKAIAVYRDGCKRTQPLNTSKHAKDSKKDMAAFAAEVAAAPRAVRRKLPEERQAITHKFSIGGHEGYLTVGMYEDGTPYWNASEIAVAKGSIRPLMVLPSLAMVMNTSPGVPLKVLVDKFSHTRFEPSGFTGNKDIPIAKSITDYIFRWLALKFLPTAERPVSLDGVVENTASDATEPAQAAPVVEDPNQLKFNIIPAKTSAFLNQADAPPCHTCGSIMVRSGACYKCGNCGATSGCS
jgi:ribonucleoside-diphosphate reductase alpha chain